MCVCSYTSVLPICMVLCSLTASLHADGRLHILTSLRDIYSFPAYLLRVNFIYQFKTRNIFLTVGDDEDMTPLIRSLSLSLSPSLPPSLPLSLFILYYFFSTECGIWISVIRMAPLLLLVPSGPSSLELNNSAQ